MKTSTGQKILDYLAKNKQSTPKDLYNLLDLSPRAIFKQLRILLEKNLIQKIGSPPKVYYQLSRDPIVKKENSLDEQTIQAINKNFYYISPRGTEEIGVNGFEEWCHKQKLDINKTASEYLSTLKKYEQFKNNGLIDGSSKITSTFPQVALDKIFYLDFYAIERFGKTRLGQLLLLAKSSQNKKQISFLMETINPSIQKIIKEFNIDGVGFIPPSVRRETQLMNELKKRLPIKQKIMSIVKTRSSVVVAQKTLSKLADRIENAKHTIIVEDKVPFNNILLIDDAVGSGATLNETASQIKEKKLCNGLLIGLAIVGSFKGFDVISEV